MRAPGVEKEKEESQFLFTFIQAFTKWDRFCIVLAVRITKMSCEFSGHTIEIPLLFMLSFPSKNSTSYLQYHDAYSLRLTKVIYICTAFCNSKIALVYIVLFDLTRILGSRLNGKFSSVFNKKAADEIC